MIAVVNNGSTSAFTASSFVVAPASYSRLSAFAPIYEEYLIHAADFSFQPSAGTSLTGAVSLWVEYDVSDPVETTQMAASRNLSYAIANVYAGCATRLMSKLSQQTKYFTVTTGVAASLTQQASLRIATEGIPAPFSSAIGYLFVTYDCEFFVPV